MAFSRLRYTFITVFTLCAIFAGAQDNKPIGYWESFLPYNTAVGVATDGNILYTVCNQAFYSYNNNTGEMQAYSKVEGMSDIGMQSVAYDFSTSTVVLGYTDGNIDLFKDNTFYNYPYFKAKNIAGSKAITQIYTENGLAYLSTASVGVIVLDLTNRIDTENIQIRNVSNNEIIPVTCFIGAGNYYYEATAHGLYRANKNIPIQDPYNWQRIDSTDSITCLATVNNNLFLSSNSKVFTLLDDTLCTVYVSDSGIQHIDAGNNQLLIAEGSNTGGRVKIMDSLSYAIVDSFEANGPIAQSLQLLNKSFWVACPSSGLSQRIGPKEYIYGNGQTGYFGPDGPSDPNSFDLYANNKNLYIAHGAYDSKFYAKSSYAGVSYLQPNGKWTFYHPPGMLDFVALAKDESTGTAYMGSYQNGLFILSANGTSQIANQNSIFDPSYAYSGDHQIIGLALDQSDNLWITTMWSQDQLYVKTADSNWYKFIVPGISQGGPMAIDNNGQIWVASNGGDGVAIYNTNNTISNPADDASYHLTTGVGYGNLPSNNATCIAKDLNGNIWIGTDNGIGIASNCMAPFTNSPPCDAEIPIVQYDQFAGYLFAGYNITSIAVDGANRKWVGTDDGVWLLSPDASQIVYYFTEDNSPLPSNTIQKIAIDQITGDVYIGTDNGLVSFRSTATEGGTSNQNVLVFPDPVPSGYTGTIAIKGLVANADVRITDITGQLVYRTTAFGGQAVWNGMDYTGHRPQTGVYLIFVSSSDGTQTYIGKVVFIQ